MKLHRSWTAASAALVLLACISACGTSQRTKTIRSSVAAVNAARDSFVAWDRVTEHAIVEKAKPISEGGTRAELDAEMAAYRARSAPVWAAFDIVYRGLLLAATQTDDPSLAAALVEIPKLIEAIKQLTGGT